MENNIDTLLNEYLGTYTPVSYENCIETVGVDGSVNQYCNNVIPSGFAGVDFLFITKSILLIIGLYSFLKVMGVFVCQLLHHS